ncbi:hypothetical protein ACOMHN_062663 [Nucella lapillus]
MSRAVSPGAADQAHSLEAPFWSHGFEGKEASTPTSSTLPRSEAEPITLENADEKDDANEAVSDLAETYSVTGLDSASDYDDSKDEYLAPEPEALRKVTNGNHKSIGLGTTTTDLGFPHTPAPKDRTQSDRGLTQDKITGAQTTTDNGTGRES